MPIKWRILLCVLVLQLLGFALLVGWQTRDTRRALAELRDAQVEAVFNGSLHRIESLTELIERSVLDLAVVGQTLQRLASGRSAAALEAPVREQLIEHFRRFPAALGGGLWYEPRAFDPEHERYGPYVFRRDDEVVFTWDLSTEAYDYLHQDWYLRGLPADWPRDRVRDRDVYWTEPYYDQAGSMALMMSAVAPMYDAGRRLIGVATVDWTMDAMRELIAQLRITPGSRAFLIDRPSGRFVAFALDKAVVMQPATLFDWSRDVLADARDGQVGMLGDIDYRGTRYRVWFMGTRTDLVFGLLVPLDDLDAQVQASSRHSLVDALLLSLLLVAASLLLLTLAFRPFNRMLAAIAGSVDHGPDGELRLTPLAPAGRTEFAPIVAALNDVYTRVQARTRALSEANERLAEQRDQIEHLNTSLEHSVGERTRELADKNAELQASLTALQSTQRQLVDAEKHAALNRLVAGIAHEVNTPLGVALTAGSHLAEEARRLESLVSGGNIRRSDLDAFIAECRESLGIIEFNLDRAAGLVRGFKQISIDQSSEARRQFMLGDYIGDILLSLRPQLKRTRIEVRVQCPPGIVVDGYPGAFSQVLANLVMNSLAHGFDDGDDGRIEIVVAAGEPITLDYRDSGAGIAAEDLPRIFDPFFTTKREVGGSGLGLHIVFNLVTQRLGGTIRCSSEPGDGVHFRIELPRIAPRHTADPAQDSPKTGEPA